jgi:flavin reductase (DIM6/NTAB) family NADH-FMN oxidoreductase RutF
MNSGFKKIDVKEITDNTFQLIDKDWMLITAGNNESFNTMTASWGGFGILWQRPVAICFIRPQRYTFGFVEDSNYFTLSFFPEKFRSILNFCGQKSGRHIDKARETGLIPFETENKSIAFEQARLVLECKKLYNDTINPELFIDREIAKTFYPGKDYHKFFIAEITNCFIKEK